MGQLILSAEATFLIGTMARWRSLLALFVITADDLVRLIMLFLDFTNL